MAEVQELGKVTEVYITLKVNRTKHSFDFIVTGAKGIDGQMTTEVGERVLDDTLDALAAAARDGWRSQHTPRRD